MAEVLLYPWANGAYVKNSFYIKVEYSTSQNKITIDKITGFSQNGYTYYDTYNRVHTITFPGGTGSITTSSPAGCGASAQGYVWGGTPCTFNSSGGTDYISLTLPKTNAASFSNIEFWTEAPNITVPFEPPIQPPTLTTMEITGVDYNSIDFEFSVSNDGGEEPTGNQIQTGYGISETELTWGFYGQYKDTITLLKPGTQYYVQGWAKNSGGETYTNMATVTTLGLPKPISNLTLSLEEKNIIISFTPPANPPEGKGELNYFGWLYHNGKTITPEGYSQLSDLVDKEINSSFSFSTKDGNISFALTDSINQGDKMQIKILPYILYNENMYYDYQNKVESSITTYNSAEFIYISPKGAEDYIGVELYIIKDNKKIQIFGK